MTAERAPAPYVLTVERARHNWPAGYFDALIGCRMTILDDRGRPARGDLEAVRETETHIELTLTKIGPEFEDPEP